MYSLSADSACGVSVPAVVTTEVFFLMEHWICLNGLATWTKASTYIRMYVCMYVCVDNPCQQTSVSNVV